MDRHEVEFLEHCSDWAELQGVRVLLHRSPADSETWIAQIELKDLQGAWLSQPVVMTRSFSKKSTIEERRGLLYTRLSKAAAIGRRDRIEHVTHRPYAAASAKVVTPWQRDDTKGRKR